MAVPYTFATATSSIPLSQLDSNFATAITLGNTAVYLGNTTTSIGNLTLTNTTISSVAVTFPNSYLANSSVTLGTTNVSLGGTATTIAGLTLTGATLGGTFSGTSVTDSGLTSGRVTYAGTGGLLQDSANMTFNGTTLTLANDASISGLTVGKGGGSVSTNTALGTSALQANTTGIQNTAVGYQSLYSNSNASNNTAFGYQAGYGITGTNANTTGSNNTYIGYQTVGSAVANTNEMVIGYQAVGLGSNTTVIGNTSTTLTQTYGVTKSTNYTVATLPSASTSGVGARAFVTDALSPSFGVAVTGGGAVAVPVYVNASNTWYVG
jgi:hypothetical protein